LIVLRLKAELVGQHRARAGAIEVQPAQDRTSIVAPGIPSGRAPSVIVLLNAHDASARPLIALRMSAVRSPRSARPRPARSKPRYRMIRPRPPRLTGRRPPPGQCVHARRQQQHDAGDHQDHRGGLFEQPQAVLYQGDHGATDDRVASSGPRPPNSEVPPITAAPTA